jgi:adenylyltransferase/sulfurtransferase
MKSITVAALKNLLSEKQDLILIDVREEHERNVFNIGGIHIPLDSIVENLDQIPTDKTVVLYCRKGIRSFIAIQRLQRKMPFENLVNLEGGLDAWD